MECTAAPLPTSTAVTAATSMTAADSNRYDIDEVSAKRSHLHRSEALKANTAVVSFAG